VRDLRDILAECMRRERLGLMRPLWADWCAADNLGGPEQVRIRADHLIRLLAVHGVSLVRSSEPATIAQTSPTVWRWGLAGTDAERLIRASADDPNEWQIVRAEGDQETIQMRFRLAEAYVLSGRVLGGDREVLKEQGVLTKLAAALEIHRCNAVAS
jgi:hypothetical protein